MALGEYRIVLFTFISLASCLCCSATCAPESYIPRSYVSWTEDNIEGASMALANCYIDNIHMMDRINRSHDNSSEFDIIMYARLLKQSRMKVVQHILSMCASDMRICAVDFQACHHNSSCALSQAIKCQSQLLTCTRILGTTEW